MEKLTEILIGSMFFLGVGAVVLFLFQLPNVSSLTDKAERLLRNNKVVIEKYGNKSFVYLESK